MADRWMDERDREWRERDWRRAESYGRGGEDRDRSRDVRRWEEDRTWAGPQEGEAEGYDDLSRGRSWRDEDADYRGRYGGESYGRGGGRTQAYRSGPARYRYGQPEEDYGRSYADESGRADYGARFRQSYGLHPERRWQEDEGEPERSRYGAWPARHEYERQYGEDRNATAASGGYDYASERDRERDRWREQRDEGFLQRAGERLGAWFRGGREDRDERVWRREDYGREARLMERSHRGVGPKGYRRSDERINEEAHERLTDDPWLDASNIQVEVKDAEVTLSGNVDNREAKHRAERLVEEISGVRHVQNNLRVNPNAGFTGAGRGFGSSALEAEMRRNEAASGTDKPTASTDRDRTKRT